MAALCQAALILLHMRDMIIPRQFDDTRAIKA